MDTGVNANPAGASSSLRTPRIVVIGAGIAGLVAALELADAGMDVTVIEKEAAPGGKLRQIVVDGASIDAGPTVFTMRWVFEELFAAVGEDLAAQLTLHPATILARHAWSTTERLDLFADVERSADAIGRFAGANDAQGYREFCLRAKRIYQTLEGPFLRAAKPSPLALVTAGGLRGLGALGALAPFTSMWKALSEYFHDPRLRQLFGRYATYCGSSPFDAPATLMLVAHVEQEGVWLVEGGMQRLPATLAALTAARGARFLHGTAVQEILVAGGKASGVRLANGEVIEADAVVANSDVAAFAAGCFGKAAASAAPATKPADRSLSALTLAMVARTDGFSLSRHNVFFSREYKAEFDDLGAGTLPRAPTVYVCAQDRDAADGVRSQGAERLFMIVNAPPLGDARPLDPAEIATCVERIVGQLGRCGLTVERSADRTTMTTPTAFEQLFPATGGALYGAASHGALASFQRPTARSKLTGLYLASGSAHPGPGVPMAALSGRLAAAALKADLGSTARSRMTVTPGGTSMR
jgi:1-hydroxycarotenoid 3,4-desaturase